MKLRLAKSDVRKLDKPIRAFHYTVGDPFQGYSKGVWTARNKGLAVLAILASIPGATKYNIKLVELTDHEFDVACQGIEQEDFLDGIELDWIRELAAKR